MENTISTKFMCTGNEFIDFAAATEEGLLRVAAGLKISREQKGGGGGLKQPHQHQTVVGGGSFPVVWLVCPAHLLATPSCGCPADVIIC